MFMCRWCIVFGLSLVLECLNIMEISFIYFLFDYNVNEKYDRRD